MTTFEPKQLVLSKIKGFPDWPSVIVPEDAIPEKLKTAKNKKFMENYLHEDQICVKFYYDDQYSFTKTTNIKPLSEQIVKDYLISVGEKIPGSEQDEAATAGIASKRGGRKKRITEAYLKVLEVPIDEFLQWGSWGKPVTPEPVIEEEVEIAERKVRKRRSKEVNEDEEDEDISYGNRKQKKAKGKKPGRPKKTEVKKRAGRKPVKQVEEFEEFDEDIIIDDGDDDDEEYEGSEESPEVEVEEEAEDDVEEEEEEEEEEEQEEEEEFEDELKLKQPKDFVFDFNTIPPASALATEVAEMTSWCQDLRKELQSLIFPLKKQKRGEVPASPPATQNTDVVEVKEEDVKKKEETPSVEETPKKEEEEVKEEPVEEEEEEDIPVNYKKLNKSIDELITPLITADLSISILKSTGLSNIIHIILSKPEFQTPTTKKLNDWWKSVFNYTVTVDEHWSDDFTIAMHLKEEADRKSREAEKKRKRKEEKRLNALLSNGSASASVSTSVVSTPAPE